MQCSGQDTNGYVDWTYLNWWAHECSNKVWCQWPILFQNQCPGVFQYLWASMFPFTFSLHDRQLHYTVLLPSCISLPSMTLVVFAVTLYMIFHGFYFLQGVHDGGNNGAAHKQASFLQKFYFGWRVGSPPHDTLSLLLLLGFLIFRVGGYDGYGADHKWASFFTWHVPLWLQGMSFCSFLSPTLFHINK